MAVYLGALRAGVAVAPLAPSSTAQTIADMAANAEAQLLFVDAGVAHTLAPVRKQLAMPWIALDESNVGTRFSQWLAPEGSRPTPQTIEPDWPFNIIYSSGTTGTPKGIVQPHRMRWQHVQRARPQGYGPEAVTMIATPLYSNTTLVSVFPTLTLGGTVVLMPKFDAARYLALAEQPSRHAHHAGAGAIPAPDGPSGVRPPRPVVLSHEALHQRALLRRAQGRHPETLAGRPGRVLRHDRGWRHLHPRRP
jgi:acyl-CoA synthetase (AMP-forming)/AMP-acid ligase II